MKWVIDCSASAALFLPDESSHSVREFFDRLKKADKLLIPSLWWYELANVLIVSERRKRLNYRDVTKITSLFERLNLETDNSTGFFYLERLYELAQRYKISSYDASYLELAIRDQANLCSLDIKLTQAAKNSGVRVYELV